MEVVIVSHLLPEKDLQINTLAADIVRYINTSGILITVNTLINRVRVWKLYLLTSKIKLLILRSCTGYRKLSMI